MRFLDGTPWRFSLRFQYQHMMHRGFEKRLLVLKTCVFFPTCQVMVVRFYQSCSPPPPPPHPPPPHRSPDPSGHCWTSTASCRSQWALPDLHRELKIPVGTAGPQPRAPDPNGHCRTSTASSRSQWALPDLNRDFQIAGHCRTSTATSRSQWALPDLNGKNVRKDVR